jgi:class 3 adenylate cyclase
VQCPDNLAQPVARRRPKGGSSRNVWQSRLVEDRNRPVGLFLIEFQHAMADCEAETPEADRLVFRVGLHLGDVIVDGEDSYGDGINVAARLEAEAIPGGIVTSGAVHEATAGRVR